MSDSESSGEQQIRVQQKMQAKLRELLDRGKGITPFYDDDTLLLIYKDCFHTEHVFLNKLEIIARNHKNAQQQEDKDWIQFKQQQKAANKVPTNGQTAHQRLRFNFLEDKALVQRAKNFDPEKQRQWWEKRKEEFREKQENKYRGNYQNRNKYQQKEEQQEVAQPEKRLKFKQKVEQKSTPNTNNEPSQAPPPLQESNPKTETKPVERKQKYAEKKVEKVEPTGSGTKNKQENASKTESAEVKKEVKPAYKPKYQEKVQKVETVVKQQPKVQEKPQKVQVPAPAQQPKPVVVQPTPQKTGDSSLKKTTSQVQLDPEVKRQFEESCRLNSFILKFIPPAAKLQKISYIRDPNGTYRQVKTRQTLPK